MQNYKQIRTENKNSPYTNCRIQAALLEAAGIEPASENRSIRSSTSVVCLLISRNAAPTNRLCIPAAHCATADYVRPQQTFTAS